MSAQFLHKKECLRKFSNANFIHDSGPFDRKKRYQGICYSGCEPFYIIIIIHHTPFTGYNTVLYRAAQQFIYKSCSDIKEKLEFAYGS